ncbi:hypothetical protein AM501_09965 [Aneurinibacillus migulanus]|uniref:hypothetical protein n=1 Tax=Aneurinibacillus migulanus TaxID=47500 RepID=UPI0005BC5D70|nr:hypothetical protein [Aneurinibacillus migulanus]KIV56469.1 hypothetical protein TS64_09380 [Aneurinibacillus migulanus]KPD08477.1 hypothetical protein AM501_09965 [Aneurinibacillus migulanus]
MSKRKSDEIRGKVPLKTTLLVTFSFVSFTVIALFCSIQILDGLTNPDHHWKISVIVSVIIMLPLAIYVVKYVFSNFDWKKHIFIQKISMLFTIQL